LGLGKRGTNPSLFFRHERPRSHRQKTPRCSLIAVQKNFHVPCPCSRPTGPLGAPRTKFTPRLPPAALLRGGKTEVIDEGWRPSPVNGPGSGASFRGRPRQRLQPPLRGQRPTCPVLPALNIQAPRRHGARAMGALSTEEQGRAPSTHGSPVNAEIASLLPASVAYAPVPNPKSDRAAHPDSEPVRTSPLARSTRRSSSRCPPANKRITTGSIKTSTG